MTNLIYFFIKNNIHNYVFCSFYFCFIFKLRINLGNSAIKKNNKNPKTSENTKAIYGKANVNKKKKEIAKAKTTYKKCMKM